ncbi:transmembrane protein 198-like isoform X1 [Ptychodera flava]|uniref:transmembrane protein 198-like isoform X1 n=1 Tax=Ptychodera flava TaxID=63121 RepID=UPI00396A4244
MKMGSDIDLAVAMATRNQDTSEVPTVALSVCEAMKYTYDIAPTIICALAFIFGIVFCFFGYRCFKAVLFLVGFVFGSILVYAICHEEAVLSTAANAGIAVAAGLLCGLITMLVQYVGLFMTGFHLGLFLAVAILIALEQFWHPTSLWIPIGILFGIGLLFAVCNLQWQKTCTILATSLIGGAMITTSIDYFIEKFTMVQYIWDRFTAEDSQPVCWYSWIILAVWPFLFLIGVVIQFKITGKNYDHHDAYSSNSLFNTITGCLQFSKTEKGAVKTAVVKHRKKKRIELAKIRQKDQHEKEKKSVDTTDISNVVVKSPKRKRVELAKIRQREAREAKQRKYRYMYKVRRFNGDIVSQAYLQSIQSHLSPEMKKMASKTHLPTTPQSEEAQLQVEMLSPTAAALAHTDIASV